MDLYKLKFWEMMLFVASSKLFWFMIFMNHTCIIAQHLSMHLCLFYFVQTIDLPLHDNKVVAL